MLGLPLSPIGRAVIPWREVFFFLRDGTVGYIFLSRCRHLPPFGVLENAWKDVRTPPTGLLDSIFLFVWLVGFGFFLAILGLHS